MCTRHRPARESAPLLAFEPRGPAPEYSSRWSTGAEPGRCVDLPLEHLISPTTRSPESHRLKGKDRSENGRRLDRQTTEAFCVGARSRQSHPPAAELADK